jgi:hypothetical protein
MFIGANKVARIVVKKYLPCLPAPLLGETTERLGNIEASP